MTDSTATYRRAKKITIPTHPHLVVMAGNAHAEWEEREGYPTPSAYGYTSSLEAIICWALSLSVQDYDRIVVEGRELAKRLDPLPAIRREPAITAREGSVFAPASIGGLSGLPDHPRVKGIAGRRHPGKDGSESQDEASGSNKRPRRRS